MMKTHDQLHERLVGRLRRLARTPAFLVAGTGLLLGAAAIGVGDSENSTLPGETHLFLADDAPFVRVQGTDSGFVGIYADAAGTQPCATVPLGKVDTLYVIATTGFETQSGLSAASFRIQVTNPTGYHFAYLNPDAPINPIVGQPFDLTPEDPYDNRGFILWFRECQTLTHRAGDRIPFGRVLVANLSGGPTELRIERFSFIDRNPYMTDCSWFFGNSWSMRPCDTDPTGETIVSRVHVNDPACDPNASCAEDCTEKPCVDLVANISPSLGYCPGDSVTAQIRFSSCASSPQDVQIFFNYDLMAQYEQVAPGETVEFTRKFRFDSCPNKGRPFVFGAVARNDICSEPTGKVVRVGNGCPNCDLPYCATVYRSVPYDGEIGDTLSVYIQTQRVEDLFGLSGRLRFSPSAPLQAIGVNCVDESGLPLDLGRDALCYGRVDPMEGTVDFAVSRRAGEFGATGLLRVARVDVMFPPGTDPDACAFVALEDVNAIDSFGRSICVQTPTSVSAVCSRSTCAVWPGDANNDGFVDGDDILALAAYWAQRGPARGRSCFWAEAIGPCWEARDAMYSDAYGDGEVGVEDMLCIGVNWGRSHPATGKPIVPHGDPIAMRAALMEMQHFLEVRPGNEPGLDAIATVVADLIEKGVAPRASALEQNVPNPFNPSTRVRFSVATAGPVSLRLFDVAGRRIRNLTQGDYEPGRYGVDWNGTDDHGRPVPSGIYYCQAVIDGQTFGRKMVLSR